MGCTLNPEVPFAYRDTAFSRAFFRGPSGECPANGKNRHVVRNAQRGGAPVYWCKHTRDAFLLSLDSLAGKNRFLLVYSAQYSAVSSYSQSANFPKARARDASLTQHLPRIMLQARDLHYTNRYINRYISKAVQKV
jgi:hypothetical protein